MNFINWELLREPYNWVIVIVMLALGVFGLYLIQEPLSHLPRVGLGD